jgi:HAD superfamily hydrolase (TIGR01509 family)
MDSTTAQEYKCIIFDCDNVLVDTEAIMLSVLVEIVKDFGVNMTIEEAVVKFCGKSMQEIISNLEAISNSKFPEDFEAKYRALSYEKFRKELQPKAGVKELLANIKVPFCVASNGPREKIELNLGLTGLLDFFTPDTIFSAYDINHWKPDPKLYVHASKSMGFLPSQCIVIEDSIPGIEAGINGGFKVYGLSNGFNSQELAEKGAIIVNDMHELHKILNRKTNH